MKYHSPSRRHFLQSAGKFALALPLLPSLMPQSARAANPNGPKFFVFIGSGHGGVNYENMFPQVPMANKQVLYASTQHEMRWDSLSNLLTTTVSELNPNGESQLSPVLGSFLNPWLDRINVIQGFDMLHSNGHHSAHLGNFHAHDGRNRSLNYDPRLELPPMPTIDQIMAKSPNFYVASDRPANKAMNFGMGGNYSWEIQANQMVEKEKHLAGDLFGTVFNFDAAGPVQERINLIDLVLEDYKRLTQSAFGPGKRLGSDDKLRLEQFADQLNETEIRLRNRSMTCPFATGQDRPENIWNWGNSYSFAEERWDDYIDVMMLAFRCGRSRIATVGAGITSEIPGDWHQDYAHQHTGAAQQVEVARANRFIAQHVFTRVLEAMNEDMGWGDGTTYLDQALVYWQQEAGLNTHDWNNMPTIMAGNAGGYFRTGYHVDYRNVAFVKQNSVTKPGLPVQRWLRDALLSMNIQESEFEREGMYGYGDPYIAPYNGNESSYPMQLRQDCNLSLPLIVV